MHSVDKVIEKLNSSLDDLRESIIEHWDAREVHSDCSICQIGGMLYLLSEAAALTASENKDQRGKA